jgi:hypothetical protein
MPTLSFMMPIVKHSCSILSTNSARHQWGTHASLPGAELIVDSGPLVWFSGVVDVFRRVWPCAVYASRLMLPSLKINVRIHHRWHGVKELSANNLRQSFRPPTDRSGSAKGLRMSGLADELDVAQPKSCRPLLTRTTAASSSSPCLENATFLEKGLG